MCPDTFSRRAWSPATSTSSRECASLAHSACYFPGSSIGIYWKKNKLFAKGLSI